MCLGIPGRIVEHVGADDAVATVDVDGAERTISVQVLLADGVALDVGDWVLIHMGFAMARIDEARAADLSRYLDGIRQSDGGDAGANARR